MDEPVVHQELNPGRRQQVEDRRRLKLVSRHQLAADDARAGRHQVRRVGEDVLERDVAAEAPADGPIARIVQVVVRAVGRARVAQRGIEVVPGSAALRAAAPRCRADSSREGPSRISPRRNMRADAAAGTTVGFLSKPVMRSSSRSVMGTCFPLHERRRIDDGHDLRHHRVATTFLVAAEQILDSVERHGCLRVERRYRGRVHFDVVNRISGSSRFVV